MQRGQNPTSPGCVTTRIDGFGLPAIFAKRGTHLSVEADYNKARSSSGWPDTSIEPVLCPVSRRSAAQPNTGVGFLSGPSATKVKEPEIALC